MVSFADAFKSAYRGEPAQEPASKPEPKPEPKPEKAAPEKSDPKPEVEFNRKQSKTQKRFNIGENDPAPEAPPSDEPKKPEPKPEAKPEEQREAPADKLRKQYELTKAELEKLKSELASRSNQSFDPVEVERLRNEREELAKAVERLRIEESPAFKQKFNAPIENAIKRAKDLVPQETRQRLEYLLRQPQSESRLTELEAIVSDLPQMRQAEIARLAGTISDVIAERDTEIASAGQRLKIEQQEKAREQKEWAEKMFKDTLDAATNDLPMFQVKDGDEEHNASVKARVDRARKLMLGENDPAELSEAAFWAVVGQDALPLLSAAKAEIKKLQGELDALRNARPNLSETAGDGGDTGQPKSFAEAVRAALKG